MNNQSENSKACELSSSFPFTDSRKGRNHIYLNKLKSYISNRSLWCISKENKLRQILLILLTEKESLIPKESFEKSPEQYGIDLISIVQHFSHMDISGGKLVVKKNIRRWSKIIDYFLSFLIIVSVVLLCYDVPYNNPRSTESLIIQYIDISITMFFLIEAIAKIIAKGGFQNSYIGITPYFLNFWDFIDFFVLVISMTQIYYYFSANGDQNKLKSIKVLRVIRAIKPLRIFNKNNELKIIMNAVVDSLPSIATIFILVFIFAHMGIMFGMLLFQGKFYSCQNFIVEFENLIKTRRDWYDAGGEWINADSNYDDYISSFTPIYRLASIEGWINLLNNGIDAVDIDMQPIYNHRVYTWFYFILVLIVLKFFMFNIYIAIVVDYFHRNLASNRIANGSVFTKIQIQWIEIQNHWLKKNIPKHPKPPKSKWFRCLYKLANNKVYDAFSLIIVIVYSTLIATKNVEMSESENEFLVEMSIVFVFISDFDISLKILTNLQNIWIMNKLFYLELVWAGSANICAILYMAKVETQTQMLIIFLRSFKILELLKIFNRKNTLLKIIWHEFDQIKTLFALFGILLLVLAITAMNMFSMKMYRKNYYENNSFNTFFRSYLLMIGLAVQEQRYDIMTDLASDQRSGDIEWINDQTWEQYQQFGPRECGSVFASFLFSGLLVNILDLFFNLAVGIFIEVLSKDKNDNSLVIKNKDFEKFKKLWVSYDTQNRGWITLEELWFLIYELPEPLGINRNIPEYDDRYSYEWIYRSKKTYNEIMSFLTHIYTKHDPYGPIDVIMVDGEGFLIHKAKKICIKESKILAFLKEFKLTVKNGVWVYYSDLSKQLIERAFQRTHAEYKTSNARLNRKITKSWNKLYKFKFERTWPDATTDIMYVGNILKRRFKRARSNGIFKRRFTNMPDLHILNEIQFDYFDQSNNDNSIMREDHKVRSIYISEK